jgi:NADH-quinone oxidoreductase subunit A
LRRSKAREYGRESGEHNDKNDSSGEDGTSSAQPSPSEHGEVEPVEPAAAGVQAGAAQLGPFLVYALAVLGVLVFVLLASWFLGGRVPRRTATEEPFESGIVPVAGEGGLRLSVEFFLVAMFFVVFDLETIFLFAWAVSAKELGWPAFAAVSLFVLVLLVALVYELATGALDWGGRRAVSRASAAREGTR